VSSRVAIDTRNALDRGPAAGRLPLPTEMTLLQGLAIARWCSWGWVVVTTVLQRNDLKRPVMASLFIFLALFGCAVCTYQLIRAPRWLLSKRLACTEAGFSAFMLIADGWVFKSDHNFVGGQSLASSGPLVAAMAAALVLGPRIGSVLAAAVGLARVPGGLVNGVTEWPADRALSVASTVIQYSIAALMFGLVTKRLRIVETEVVSRRARDEVAATLHDGVLQTLALVERRTRDTDPELAAEARLSDRELRSWLFHGRTTPEQLSTFPAALYAVADKVSRSHDLKITVNCLLDDDLSADTPSHQALLSAVGEALTNVAKHADASQVVVFADEEDNGAVFVSVRDNGSGFDTSQLADTDRHGISGSITNRMNTVGGRAEITSTVGSGTEVRLWNK
jgi:signal transduction histidine kinase